MLVNHRQLFLLALLVIGIYWGVALYWLAQPKAYIPFGDMGNVVGSMKIQLLSSTIEDPITESESLDETRETYEEILKEVPPISSDAAINTQENTNEITESSKAPSEQTSAASQMQESSAGLGGENPVSVNYLQALAVHLNQHKIYPQRAQRRKLTGRIHIQLTIDNQGQLLDYAITRSSGHPILDNTVDTMVRRANPYPFPELTSTQSSITIEIPIIFQPR